MMHIHIINLRGHKMEDTVDNLKTCKNIKQNPEDTYTFEA